MIPLTYCCFFCYSLEGYDNYAQLDSDGINTVQPLVLPPPTIEGGKGTVPPLPPLPTKTGQATPMPAGTGLPGDKAAPAAPAAGGSPAHAKLMPGPDENSVILETDDGFTTLRVSGDDMAKVKDASGVAKDAKAAKDAKKGCGCDCLPKTGPGEQIKKDKAAQDKAQKDKEADNEEKAKKGKEETKKKEEEAKEEDEKKKKEVEKLKGEAVKAKADAAKKKADAEDGKKLEKAKKK